jgi:hypothetical protein
MSAAPLLDLRVTHPFYANLRCGDLKIAPSAGTEALMRRLRLTCKAFPDHISLYAERDAAGVAFAAAAAPVSLDFVLRPRGAGFALITDLAAIGAQPAPLFTNAGVAAVDPLNLRLTTRTARATETLAVRTPSAHEPFVLAGAPLAGTTTAGFAVTGAGAVNDVAADLRRITVDTSAAAPGAAFQISYPVRPAKPNGALAEVALALDAVLLAPAATPRAFVVPLAAAASPWAYYVLTDLAADISTLRIVDATPGNGPRQITFADAGRVDLTQTPDAADAVGQDLIRRNPGRRVLRLLSDAPVPARETPLGQLELRLVEARLMAALPNPRPDHLVSLRTAPAPAPARIARYGVLTLPSNGPQP